MPSITLSFPKIDRVRDLLHIGCNTADPLKVPPVFRNKKWREIRFDIDPEVKPDVVGTITDLSHFKKDSMDAIFCSHILEHLYTHEVPIAFKECHRVLMPKGCLVLRVPNLEVAARLILKQGLYSVAYKAKSGAIRPVDILYGNTASIKGGNKFFAHHTGFTPKALTVLLKRAGFQNCELAVGKFDLHCAAWKT